MAELIAEFCQNHKGQRSILGEMIRAAAENGAHYGKIQSIWVDDLTRRARFEAGKTDAQGKTLIVKRPYQPEYDRLKNLELSLEDHVWFIDECRKAGLIPLTTVFTRGSVPGVAAMPWPKRMVKVASYDCASVPLLRELSKRFDTILVSTGATYDREIEEAAATLKGKDLVLFHCVTAYPNTLDNCHLARMEYLRKFAPRVGWSDHTRVETDGIRAAMAAIALGADMVERHFTILPAGETKDGPVSITPAHLKQLSDFNKLGKAEQLAEAKKAIPDFQRVVGQARRPLSHEELLNRDYYRGRFATREGDKTLFNWEEAMTDNKDL